MRLIKKADGWYNLYDGDIGIGSTHKELQVYKLSKENCDEIFGVVDVEKLADFYGAEANGNIDFKFGANQGFEDGFNKAMELNKDKLFTLEHMRNMMVIGANCEREKGDFTFEFEAYTNHLQQPNEIEVEIVKESIGRVKLGVGSQLEQMMPKLDSDGCLILKKL